VWKDGGEVCNHSKVVAISVSVLAVNNSLICHGLFPATRFITNASQIAYTKINTPTKDNKLPYELTAFQPVNASA